MKRKAMAAVAALGVLLAACSGGPDTVEVPDVVGLGDVDAWYALSQADLEWEPADPNWGSRIVTDDTRNVVSAQQPRAGATAEAGDTVMLTFRVESTATTEPADASDPTDAEPDSRPAPTEDVAPRGSLARQVEDAFAESYGWPDEDFWSQIESFSDRDAPRVTVATSLADKAENEEDAMGICRAVTSVSHSVTADFTGVYVTSGEGGPFLAECDVPTS